MQLKVLHPQKFVAACNLQTLFVLACHLAEVSVTFARVATSWKSPGFFFLSWKVLVSLNFVYKSWKNFKKFSRDLPGQNVKFFFVVITGTL